MLPRRVLAILILVVAVAGLGAPDPAVSASRPRWNLVETEGLVDSLVQEAMESEHLPGVAFVLVADGKIQMARGWGFADLERRQPVRPDRTLFRVGSITKALTAMAVVQLHDAGRIDLDEDVNRYLKPAVVAEKFGEPVRIRHLLTHTGGFDQTGLGRHASTKAARPSLAEFVRDELVRIRPPGILATYDTYGITLAGHLVERVSGKSYADYMRQEIFLPLGMERAFVEAPKKLRSDLAVGYGFQDGNYIPQRYEIYVTTPASSVDATARDMGRFLIAALGDGSNESGRFLSSEAAKRIKLPQFREHPEFPGFAWGFWEVLGKQGRVIHHGGSMLGFSSELWLLPEHGLGFFLATNRDGDAGGGPVRLAGKMSRALMGQWFPGDDGSGHPQAKKVAVDTTELAGNWAATLYCHTCAAGEGWTMYYAPLESVEPGVIQYEGSRWIAEAPGVFVSEDGQDRMAFIQDGKKRVRYLIHERFRLAREMLDDALLEEVFGNHWPAGKPRFLAAEVARANGEWGKAAVEFEKIARTQSEPGRAWFRAGSAWLRAGKSGRAMAALEQSWEDGRWKAESAYLLAMAHNLQQDNDNALLWLRRAVSADLEEPERLQEDPRLDPLRGDPRFAKLLEEAGLRADP